MQFEEESRTALYIYMLRSLAAFSVLQRRSTCVSAEFPEKISQIVITTFQTDLHYRQVCFFQIMSCFFYPVCLSLCNRTGDWTLCPADSDTWKMGRTPLSDCQWCVIGLGYLFCFTDGIHNFSDHSYGDYSRSSSWKFSYSLYGAV